MSCELCTDADVHTDDATGSTVADFAFAATFTNFAKFPSFATLVTFEDILHPPEVPDDDLDGWGHLH